MEGQFRLVTIGVYGFDEASFFTALTRAGIDTLCDIRRRRGVRGSAYSFANSGRLQACLRDLGIRYVYLKELAPSQAVREIQKDDDDDRGIAKRDRRVLSPAFVRAYSDQCLQAFDAEAFLRAVGPSAHAIALLCVEREPSACHRSIVAGVLCRELGIEPEHIEP